VIDVNPATLDQSAASRADAGLPRGGLYRRLRRAVADAALPTGARGPAVTESDLAGLPPVVQRYLRFMGVVGRPCDWSFRVRFRGRFQIRPGSAWLPADAWQYNTAAQPARIFVMRLRVGHLVPFYGRDSYVQGRGHMIGTLFGRKVVDGSGAEFDHSELVIYLNDAVLLAPSTLLGPATCWTRVDDDSFDVALTDRGRTISARVRVDDRGAPVTFVADRYATLPQGLVLAPWRTPIQRWETAGDRPVPGPASVCYDLPTGPYCYAEGQFVRTSIAFNVAPDQL
jgi:Family of unknown function (DUF6544)